MKKTICLSIALVLCVTCFGGCKKEPETTGKIPTNAVPVFQKIAVPISRLAEKPITAEIGDTGVTVDLNYLAWPTITKGENNTLYAAASVRRGHIDPFGATAFFESTDGGKTWSEPRIIHDSPVDDRDVGLLYVGEGKMVASFFTIGARSFMPNGKYAHHWGNCDDTQRQAKLDQWNTYAPQLLADFSGSFIMLSEDYGKTWSDPIRVPFSCPHGPSLMQDGKTLMCSTVGDNIFSVYLSEDFGKTWYLSTAVALPILQEKGGYYEPHVIQLSDGSLLGGVRGETKDDNRQTVLSIWTLKSQDGKTWSTAEKVSSVNGAPPHFLELSNGSVLMTYSYRQDNYGVRGCISYDGGKTWSEEQLIISENTSQRNNDLGYPASVELDDGTIITAYYQPYGNDAPASLLYTKWQLLTIDSK